MEMSPKAIAAVTFPVVRKGYDPEQVRSFLSQLSRGVEELQNRALQAEAKSRLAGAAPPAAEETANVEAISKTLLLAQRTADATVAEARDEAEGIRRQAAERAESVMAEAKAQGSQMIVAVEQEALRAGEVARSRVAAEVDALEARRTALSADVDALSAHITTQRERLAATVATLTQALQRPDNLQDPARPRLSTPPDVPPTAPLPPSSEPVRSVEPPAAERVPPIFDLGTMEATGGFPAPEAPAGAVESIEPIEPITQEVPLVGQSEPEVWSFFDDGPEGDDRWKR